MILCEIEKTVGCFKCPYRDCTFDERNEARKRREYNKRHREERGIEVNERKPV